MRYLRKFNESSDEKIPSGHRHSWNDIKERLLYLTDIGFEIDEESKVTYFRDDEGDRCDITKAHYLNTEITLHKNYPDVDDVSSRHIGNSTKYKYYVSWNDSILEMWEAIASVCSHFEECRHNLTQDADGWKVSFIIYTPVEEEIRNVEKERRLKEDVINKISNSFDGRRSNILDSFSSASRNKINKNKLGENMWSYQGSYEEGFLVMALNFEGSQPAQFRRVFQPKLESGLNYFQNLVKGFGKVELRKITEEDLDKLANLTPATRQVGVEYFKDRYLGLMGYIIEFDYDKMFNKVKEDLR